MTDTLDPSFQIRDQAGLDKNISNSEYSRYTRGVSDRRIDGELITHHARGFQRSASPDQFPPLGYILAWSQRFFRTQPINFKGILLLTSEHGFSFGCLSHLYAPAFECDLRESQRNQYCV